MIPRLVGMIHLGPLPGAPRFTGDFDSVLTAATADAAVLAEAGFDGLIIENFGDAPFYGEEVPPATVAAMTAAVSAVAQAVPIAVGVNVLRNDALAALSVAAATGADFIRVNVLAGTMFTDQGPLIGRAAEVARLRASLGQDIAVLADVFVKHAVPPAGLTLEQAAADLWERAGAAALVVSGSGTGYPINQEDLERVAAAAPGAPIYVGSGASEGTVAQLLSTCHGVIVGTAIKEGEVTTAPVDPARAKAFVAASSK